MESQSSITGGPLLVRFPLVQFPRVRIFRLMEAVRGRFLVWYEVCVIQVILLRNKWVGIGIAYELIPLRGWGGGAHTHPSFG